MAVADTPNQHEDHHHDHGEFIAHHFDSPEQQYDSGKLGIWLFLVTEVLFFSGLFVAYTLYRNIHPEIFEQAHVFLDKYLGGLNTVVLLFSSLTMALAVRSAQLGKNRNCSVFLLITMVCASMFLGVKAVEYSHKWDMGIWVISSFDLTYQHPAPITWVGQTLHISDWLVRISVIPTLLLVGFLGASGIGKLTGKNVFAQFMAGMAIMVGGYFLGAATGQIYQNVKTNLENSQHAAAVQDQPVLLHAMTQEPASDHEGETHEANDESHTQSHGPHDAVHIQKFDRHHPDPAKLHPDIGIFFSIYYCMTGLHAIHIIGGIIALAWLFWRSLLAHWRSDYFGPVDYVGLYWHLVDLIWIFLFPLLYLID